MSSAFATVSVRTSAAASDALIKAVGSNESPFPEATAKALGFSADHGATTVVTSPEEKSPITVYVRVKDDASLEQWRLATAKALRRVEKVGSVTIDFGALTAEQLGAVAEATVLTSYRYLNYKSQPKSKKDSEKSPNGIAKAALVHPDARKAAFKKAVERGVTIATAVCQARDWVNTPPRDLRPPVFAQSIKAEAAEGVSVQIWDEKKLEREKCGGILSVGQGSSEPPRLVKITYKPAKAKKHLALVGKGITFDSGGLSLKPGTSMMTMKCDMGGAAAIVAAINAIAELELPLQVTGFACLAENLPSGTATRPGDIITMRNGKTVEVLNTDAEGRMVLGDGLSLAAEAKPTHIVDAATLTGAAMVALGTSTAAVLGNDEEFEATVRAAADTAGEAVWPLPITSEVEEQLNASHIADLRQIGTKPYAGTAFAAAFLKQFVGEASWAHLDIAGPAFNDGGARDYTSPGGTGFAVRTLVELADSLR